MADITKAVPCGVGFQHFFLMLDGYGFIILTVFAAETFV
jgi:hypothetical protein